MVDYSTLPKLSDLQLANITTKYQISEEAKELQERQENLKYLLSIRTTGIEIGSGHNIDSKAMSYPTIHNLDLWGKAKSEPSFNSEGHGILIHRDGKNRIAMVNGKWKSRR
jgi:hypothetical protein